jgi:hypothetical protein
MKMSNKKNKKSSDLSRRDFVKTTATGAVAFSILPRFTVSGLGHITPSDKLYIAAIGCGGEGRDYIRHYAEAPMLMTDRQLRYESNFP